jgi:hypothetical protein
LIVTPVPQVDFFEDVYAALPIRCPYWLTGAHWLKQVAPEHN